MSVGRNTPCPCGSGKKYKRCCAQAEEPLQAPNLPLLMTRAYEACQNGNYREAKQLCARVVEAERHPAALSLAALVCANTGEHAESLAYLEEAVTRSPHDPALYNNLGNALHALGRTNESAQAYRRAIAIRPDYAEASYNLGNCYTEMNLPDQAIDAYLQAIRFRPHYAEAYQNLGQALLNQGRFPEAEGAFNRAIELAPLDGLAYSGLAKSRKFSSDDLLYIDKLETLFAQQGGQVSEPENWHYGLGKMNDDVGRYEQAFSHYSAANRIEQRQGKFDRERQRREVDQIIERFTPEFVREMAKDGDVSELPVFIVGMPRSGTTLVEQILSSHPDACGAGELTFWGGRDKGLRAGNYLRAEVKAAAVDYLALLRSFSSTALRVTDKMPLNFLHLGLIHVAFPQARIIHCRRNPVDTCLSIYFQKFERHHPYAQDLEDLAFFYGEYERLMTHWEKIFPANVFTEIQYEDMVEDQEGQSRRLVEFCGLEWDERCLYYHSSQRMVKTASNWQVRQPIYKSSKERWRNYQGFIGPLMALLEGESRGKQR